MAEIKKQTVVLEEDMKNAIEERKQLLYTIPNVPYDIVPEGMVQKTISLSKQADTTLCSLRTRCLTGNWQRNTTS